MSKRVKPPTKIIRPPALAHPCHWGRPCKGGAPGCYTATELWERAEAKLKAIEAILGDPDLDDLGVIIYQIREVFAGRLPNNE